jgi:hypothetical protein
MDRMSLCDRDLEQMQTCLDAGRESDGFPPEESYSFEPPARVAQTFQMSGLYDLIPGATSHPIPISAIRN